MVCLGHSPVISLSSDQVLKEPKSTCMCVCVLVVECVGDKSEASKQKQEACDIFSVWNNAAI